MKKYQYILIDADETLFDFSLSEKTALYQTFHEQGYHLSDEQFQNYHDINDILWRKVETGEITHAQVRLERFVQFVQYYKLGFNPEEMAAKYIQNLAGCGLLFDGAKELCGFLHERFKTALVTNGNSFVQRTRIKAADMERYFDAIIISEEVHAAKPDTFIFEKALKELGCENKCKALMIGDSLVADIAGGLNAGIDTCWYNPNKTENKTEFKPVYTVADYQSIIDFLEAE